MTREEALINTLKWFVAGTILFSVFFGHWPA